jgi:predicted small secreted protein
VNLLTIFKEAAMKRLFLLTILILGTLFFSACNTLRVVRGTGDMTEETREVSGFNAVSLDGLGTIFIEQGNEESLHIEAEDNLMQFLETDVEGNTLVLSTREGINIVPTQGIFYYLTVRDLENITVDGLGNIDLPDLQTSRLVLDINGGGEINARSLEADNLDVDINGLGSINLDGGHVGQQTITIDGGGSYEARNMSSDTAAVSINGLGSANLWAQETLDVTIDGGGSVHYSGKPQVTQEINGVGEVSPIEE